MSERVGDHRERRGDREVPRGRFRLPDRRDQRGRVEPQDPTRREAHPGTDRPGTRFGAEWIKGNSTSVEYVGFERPTSWASIARSRRLDAKGEGRISPTERGSRDAVKTQLRPKGLLALLLPLMRRTMP